MKPPITLYPRRKFIHFAFFLLSICLTGCAQLLEFDTAQNAFSKGSEIENRQLLTGTFVESGENSISIKSSVEREMTDLTPDFYYSRAYAAINKSLKKEGELKKDGLLGNALSLKALCEWKLQKYNEARSTSKDAIVVFNEDQVPSIRDIAVMSALEGFIESDLAFIALNELQNDINSQLASASLSGMEAAQLFDNIKAFYSKYIRAGNQSANIENALTIIENSRRKAPVTHPIQVYLVMSQLACMKNWGDAIEVTFNLLKSIGLNDEGSSARKWLTAEQETYFKSREKYLEALATTLDKGKDNPLFLQWKQTL